MKLYDTIGAPNPRRVRIFLAEKQIDIPMIEINVVQGENLTGDFLKINPRGMVPVLELDDGTLIDESVAICRYIEEIHPQPNLMGTDPVSKATIESWQRHMEFDGLLAASDAFRNSFPGFASRAVPGVVEEFRAIPELARRGQRRMKLFFNSLNARLKDNPYVAGEVFSIADITAICAIDFAGARKVALPENHEYLRRWYERISDRPSISA
ncbi:MAG: glutathione S-transferase family protein [Gammaproteobacteria bacterium]